MNDRNTSTLGAGDGGHGIAVERRQVLRGAGAAAAALGLAPGLAALWPAAARAELFGETTPFSRERLVTAAQTLATQPFVDRRDEVPEALRSMDYEAYRAMSPHNDKWPVPLSPARRFCFDAMLAGFVFNNPVSLWVVEGEVARRVLFDRSMYDFFPPSNQVVPDGDLPFSGFRLHCPLNGDGRLSEFAVFQGASYFRAIGAGETYGLSARGLAIDTGEAKGEEFPLFRSFWIETPAADAKAVVVHALLDSPSTTGAYRFTLRPGDATVTDVELTLFPRREIATVGFAPFSSMFLFDTINRSAFDDYRDAVHDSDGLSIHTGADEWLWRPLSNPQRLEVSAFMDTTPHGFGLVQRKRRFTDYEDAEARYELRPTAWVEPVGDWGSGAVVLFEIPTRKETNDNIVAYWKPEAPLAAGKPFSLTYRIHWDSAAATVCPGPRVIATRQGRNFFDDRRIFVIDYLMLGQPMDSPLVQVRASAGRTSGLTVYPTPEPDVLRVSFEFDPNGAAMSELRLDFAPAEGPPAERWLYRWTN